MTFVNHDGNGIAIGTKTLAREQNHMMGTMGLGSTPQTTCAGDAMNSRSGRAVNEFVAWSSSLENLANSAGAGDEDGMAPSE